MKQLLFLLIVSCVLCTVSSTFTTADTVEVYVATESQPTETTKPPETAATAPQTEPRQVYLDVALSNEKQAAVRQICEEYGVPFDLVIAMMQVESNFDETAVSSTGDYGVMQINKVNHKRLGEVLGVTDFLNFEQSVESGCYLLSGVLEKYGDETAALMCYNCGERGAKELWAQGVHTTEYTRKVMKARNSLTWKE